MPTVAWQNQNLRRMGKSFCLKFPTGNVFLPCFLLNAGAFCVENHYTSIFFVVLDSTDLIACINSVYFVHVKGRSIYHHVRA